MVSVCIEECLGRKHSDWHSGRVEPAFLGTPSPQIKIALRCPSDLFVEASFMILPMLSTGVVGLRVSGVSNALP